MMDRQTGGNSFLPTEATQADLLAEIVSGIRYLDKYLTDEGRTLDVGAISIETERIKDGRISVTVMGDSVRK